MFFFLTSKFGARFLEFWGSSRAYIIFVLLLCGRRKMKKWGIEFVLEEINSGGKRWSKCRFTVEFLLLEVKI